MERLQLSEGAVSRRHTLKYSILPVKRSGHIGYRIPKTSIVVKNDEPLVIDEKDVTFDINDPMLIVEKIEDEPVEVEEEQTETDDKPEVESKPKSKGKRGK